MNNNIIFKMEPFWNDKIGRVEDLLMTVVSICEKGKGGEGVK